MKYVRKLSYIEQKRHFIYITREFREMFPRLKEPFTLVVDEEKFPVNIDRQGRIWASLFRSKVNFEWYSKFEISKINDNEYLLKQVE